MTSDVKLPHYFLLIKVINTDVFLTLKSFIKQFQSTTQSVNAGKLLRLHIGVQITANCFYFDLNDLKFKLQYELTPPQIFFCGYNVLQQFCHNVEGTHNIKCSQK